MKTESIDGKEIVTDYTTEEPAKKTWSKFPSRNRPYQKRFNLLGRKFSWLTIIRFSGRDNRKALRWECRCICGNLKLGLGKDLRSGHLTNCGCQTKILIGNANRTHGMRKYPEYEVWSQMKSRCLNKNNLSYYRYGGRGITICKRWLNSFEKFFSDMKKCPLGFSLERKNNDGNYTPSNCRWASRKDQMKNRSNSVGVDLSLIAKQRGIGYKYAWSLYRVGRL